MTVKNKVIYFSIAIFIAFAATSLLFNQFIPYLTEIGYSVTERGYMMSMLALVSIVGQIGVGYLSDKLGTIKRFFLYVVFIYGVTGIFAFAFDANNFFFHLTLIGFVGGVTRVINNLFETWILEVDGLFSKFGFIRTFGSLGWAVASLISGYLVVKFGFISLGYANAILCLSTILVSFLLEDANKKSETSISFKEMGTLFRNHNYILLIAIYGIAYFVYSAESITVIDLIYELGGDAQAVGNKGFIHAMSEMPMMLIVTGLVLKYGSKRLMIIGSLVLGIKYVLFAIAPNMMTIYFISALQVFSFPFILMSQKDLVNREVPEHLRSSGQMLSVSLTSGLSAIITPTVAAYLVELTSINTTLIVFALMMLIPVGIMIMYQPSKTL